MISTQGTALVVPVVDGHALEIYNDISVGSTVMMRPSCLYYRPLLPVPTVSPGEAYWYPKPPARH